MENKISKWILILQDRESGEIVFSQSVWDTKNDCKAVYNEFWQTTHRVWAISELVVSNFGSQNKWLEVKTLYC